MQTLIHLRAVLLKCHFRFQKHQCRNHDWSGIQRSGLYESRRNWSFNNTAYYTGKGKRSFTDRGHHCFLHTHTHTHTHKSIMRKALRLSGADPSFHDGTISDGHIVLTDPLTRSEYFDLQWLRQHIPATRFGTSLSSLTVCSVLVHLKV